jgi:hypothetical protein
MNDAARADGPQILSRLLEQVARGVRSTRAHGEALGLDTRRVGTSLQVAGWLGLIEADLTLTPAGLEYVFAGRGRRAAWARALWAQPWVAELLAESDGSPPLDTLASAIERLEPGLASTGQRAAATELRGVLAGMAGSPRPRPRSDADRQLLLPLAPAPALAPTPRLELASGGREFNPDAYRFVYGALLEYGELALGQIRALLDRSGAEDLPIGGYVDLAVGRGDAVRVADRLVVTPAGVRRRELAETTTSIVLSDPGYRAWLADAAAAFAGDRAAAVRREAGTAAARYTAWDRRLLGHACDPTTLAADLARIVLDRTLDSFPLAERTPWAPVVREAPVLDVWDATGLAVAAPPYLIQLLGGLAAANRLLRGPRVDVGVPDLAHRPAVVHAGLLHPGEPPPRTIPDTRSLRLRAVMHAPLLAVSTALLLTHRRRPDALEITRGRGAPTVRWQGEPVGGPLSLFEAFGAARAWHLAAGAHRSLRDEALVEILEALGIAATVGRRITLAERFFHQLGAEPDEGEVAVRLQPLASALEAWLEASAEEVG